MAKKSDLTLFLRARHIATYHSARVPTDGSEGWEWGKEDGEELREYKGKQLHWENNTKNWIKKDVAYT